MQQLGASDTLPQSRLHLSSPVNLNDRGDSTMPSDGQVDRFIPSAGGNGLSVRNGANKMREFSPGIEVPIFANVCQYYCQVTRDVGEFCHSAGRDSCRPVFSIPARPPSSISFHFMFTIYLLLPDDDDDDDDTSHMTCDHALGYKMHALRKMFFIFKNPSFFSTIANAPNIPPFNR